MQTAPKVISCHQFFFVTLTAAAAIFPRFDSSSDLKNTNDRQLTCNISRHIEANRKLLINIQDKALRFITFYFLNSLLQNTMQQRALERDREWVVLLSSVECKYVQFFRNSNLNICVWLGFDTHCSTVQRREAHLFCLRLCKCAAHENRGKRILNYEH